MSLVGTATGELLISLSPTRDVMEDISLGVARNIIINMVMKKGKLFLVVLKNW